MKEKNLGGGNYQGKEKVRGLMEVYGVFEMNKEKEKRE